MTDRSASGAPIALFAATTAVVVMSLYQAQPLVGAISADLGWRGAWAGWVGTLPLLGYALGLLLLVPLCDRVENRRLILITLAANALALAWIACPLPGAVYALGSVLTGATASAIQMLIPLAATLAPIERRGRVIGQVMSGLMLGILLSRPLATLVAAQFGWRSNNVLLAVMVAAFAVMLARRLPRYVPSTPRPYAALIASMLNLVRDTPVLRRRAWSSALCFAVLNAFWTFVALRLRAPPLRMGTTAIALFALAGVGGMVAAPLAGWAGDRGRQRLAGHAAHLAVLLGAVLAWWGGRVSSFPLGLTLMLFAAWLIDAGAIANQALGRRAVNLLASHARGRINGLFTGFSFLGGAAGSTAAGIAWAHGGWPVVCAVMGVFAAVALTTGSFEQHDATTTAAERVT